MLVELRLGSYLVVMTIKYEETTVFMAVKGAITSRFDKTFAF